MQSTHNRLILFDIDYTLFDTDHFKSSGLTEFRLYDEVIPVLETLSQRYDLGIFSEGEKEFQMAKLLKTMIDKHFKAEHKHIVVKKVDFFDSIFPAYSHKKVSLVDDKLSILKEVSDKYPSIQTIWIKRGQYALETQHLPGFAPDVTVTTLKEVLPLFERK